MLFIIIKKYIYSNTVSTRKLIWGLKINTPLYDTKKNLPKNFTFICNLPVPHILSRKCCRERESHVSHLPGRLSTAGLLLLQNVIDQKVKPKVHNRARNTWPCARCFFLRGSNLFVLLGHDSRSRRRICPLRPIPQLAYSRGVGQLVRETSRWSSIWRSCRST